MRDIWIISDTHLFHENILNFVDAKGTPIRPGFSSINAMNEFILENWNNSVKPGDIVYHLGDVFMGDREEFKRFWPKFHGKKRLIVGNHDDIKFLSCGGFFSKVSMWRMFPNRKMILSHVPIQKDSLRGFVNIHGHIHQNESPEGPYINLSVEKTGYCPIHIEDLEETVKKLLDT